MPDYVLQPGYTGPNPSPANLTPKNVPIMVSGGMLASGRPGSVGTDRSTTAGTTAKAIMAANDARQGFYLKNDTTIDVWFNIGGTAAATPGGGNMRLAANGGYFETGAFAPTEAISIIAVSGTPAITAREF